jgi:hypothetical protein
LTLDTGNWTLDTGHWILLVNNSERVRGRRREMRQMRVGCGKCGHNDGDENRMREMRTGWE